jgi:hypothetical protein
MIDADREQPMKICLPKSGILYLVVPVVQRNVVEKLFQSHGILPLIEPAMRDGNKNDIVFYMFSFEKNIKRETLQGILDSVEGTGITA